MLLSKQIINADLGKIQMCGSLQMPIRACSSMTKATLVCGPRTSIDIVCKRSEFLGAYTPAAQLATASEKQEGVRRCLARLLLRAPMELMHRHVIILVLTLPSPNEG